ncbi:MEDS domain-containing protein [Nitrosomonas supralitoralis]|nr:MEDS domain-containing protein [Nitrosomonas supralitoralis]
MFHHGLEILSTPTEGSHIVKVCQNAATKAEAVAYFIEKGLSNEEAVIIIARYALRRDVKVILQERDWDIDLLKTEGKIIFLDAEFLLSNLLVNNEIDAKAFKEFVRIPIHATKIKHGKVRAFGEMVDILWQQNLQDKAIELEGLWNDLLHSHEFSLLCTYSLDNLDPDNYDQALDSICRVHTHHITSKKYHLIESDGGAEMSDLFGAAWKRVMKNITETVHHSTQVAST